MITQDQLAELGFIPNGQAISYFTGKHRDFYMRVNNDHIIPGHDYTDVHLTLDIPWISIELKKYSSHNMSSEKVFIGKCESLSFLKEILSAVIH